MPSTDTIDEAAVRAGRRSHLDDLRRHNLASVLRLIHVGSPISRAALTHATGLNRSTIATIAGELEALGLVAVQSPVDRGRVGRPSVTLGPSDRHLALAVHPTPEAIEIALVALGGRVVRRVTFQNERVPTAREAANAVAAVLAGMRPELELDDRHRLVGIGVAVPGLVHADTGVVRVSEPLGWHDEPIADRLEEATGLVAFAANDGTCGVRAESLFGASRGLQDVVYLHAGASGMTAGVMTAGAVLEGRHGFGGGIGHILVASDGAPCTCGAAGCLAAEVTPARLVAALDAEALASADEVADAYASVPAVRDEIDRQLAALAVGLRGAINAFDPETVVLSGHLATLLRCGGDGFRDLVREHALYGSADEVRISTAPAGSDTVAIGAAELAFARILADPTVAAIV